MQGSTMLSGEKNEDAHLTFLCCHKSLIEWDVLTFKFQFFCSTIFTFFLNKVISHLGSLYRFREFCTSLLWWSVLVGTRTSCSEPWCTPPSWLLPSPPPTPLHRSTPPFFWPQMLPLVSLVFSVKDFWSCQMFRSKNDSLTFTHYGRRYCWSERWFWPQPGFVACEKVAFICLICLPFFVLISCTDLGLQICHRPCAVPSAATFHPPWAQLTDSFCHQQWHRSPTTQEC